MHSMAQALCAGLGIPTRLSRGAGASVGLEARTSLDASHSFTDAIHAHAKSAPAAFMVRDNLYESVDDAGVLARVAANPVLGVLAEGREAVEKVPDAELAKRTWRGS